MTLLLVATLSLTYTDYSHISASTNNDNEDFEDQNLIQICCAWGEELRDGILTYKIDDDDISKDQKAVVQDAIEEWDAKIDPLELEEVPDNSDITIEFEDGNDDSKDEVVDIAGETMTTFYGDGFIGKVEITINKNVQDYEFDTKTIGQIAKHEMGHALGLGHANFDANLMAEKVNDGTAFVSECEIKAVIEANYWMLGQNEEDADSTPDYPQENSMACD
ncbi:MAG: matrixin family metalloprotease [Nitrososphaeraceae archaeon]